MGSKASGRDTFFSLLRGRNLGTQVQVFVALFGGLACSGDPDAETGEAPRRAKKTQEQHETDDAIQRGADGGARLPTADAGADRPFGEDEGEPRTVPPALGDGDVELGFRCDGTATCILTDEEQETYPLKMREGRCYLADIALNGDGTILDAQFSTTWSPTETGVEFCAEDECLTCTIKERVIITEPHCGGSATACSSRVAGECVDNGCDFRSRVKPDIFTGGTYSEFYCTGAVDPCSSYENQQGCDRALGCKWFDGEEPVVETSLESDLSGRSPLPPHIPGYDLTHGLSKLTDVVALSNSSRCGIRKDGSVICWEATFPGRAVAIDGIDEAIAIAGQCAVLANGRVVCWDSGGEAVLVEQVRDAVSIETDGDDVCVLTETGALLCWRRDRSDGTLRFTNLNEFVPFGVERVTQSSKHTCVVLSDERLVCFGDNENCELGWGTCSSRYVQFAEAEADGEPYEKLEFPLRDIDVGHQFTCAVQRSGTVKCWGDRKPLGLGIGPTSNPVQLSGLDDVVDLSATYEVMYALRSDGSVVAFDGPGGGEARELSGLEKVVAVSEEHCALLETGEVVCWERDWALQSATDVRRAAAPWRVWTVPGPSPLASNHLDFGEPDAPLDGAVQVGVGSVGSCALLDNGSVSCWGVDPAEEVFAGENVKQLELDAIGVALLDDGTLWCWGDGKPLLEERTDSPTPCWTNERFDAVSVGFGVVCGTQAGVLKCDTDWSEYDALAFYQGLNDAPSPVADFAAGFDSATVLVDGKVYVAGQQRNSSNNPIYYAYGEVEGVPQVTAVSANCALGVDGLVYCWELQDRQAEPIEGLQDVVQFDERGEGGCALTSVGEVYCWGRNDTGQCSVTHTYGTVEPTRVELTEPAVEVSYTDRSACARLKSGHVACWGSLTGVGTRGSNPHPQLVLKQ